MMATSRFSVSISGFSDDSIAQFSRLSTINIAYQTY